MESVRIRLGELLVEANAITSEQLAEVLERQKSDGRRLGTLLAEAGFVTEVQVTQILSQQLSVPWVSLYHIDFSRPLLDLVPKEIAEQFGLVPIFVRRVRGLGNTLYVAMEDPSDSAALRAVEQYSGLPVRCMIAPPSDIRGAIRAYYHDGDELAPTSLPPPEVAVHRTAHNSTRPSIDPVRLRSNHTPAECEAVIDLTIASEKSTTEVTETTETLSDGALEVCAPVNTDSEDPVTLPPPSAGPVSESSAHVPVREHSMPTPKRGTSHRRVTLTLLDGTKVTLPLRSHKGPDPSRQAEAEMTLTARDIVQALRAKLHGQDASEVLGEHDRWEGLFVALLSILLKKHLIADWEFIDELKRL